MFKAIMANHRNPSYTINTRNRGQMQPVYQRLTISQRAIRKTQTLGRFKKLLETHLLSLYRE